MVGEGHDLTGDHLRYPGHICNPGYIAAGRTGLIVSNHLESWSAPGTAGRLVKAHSTVLLRHRARRCHYWGYSWPSPQNPSYCFCFASSRLRLAKMKLLAEPHTIASTLPVMARPLLMSP